MNKIEGGICAPTGFKASGVHCGIRNNKSKKDLALIISEKLAAAACTYTQNLVKGAPIGVTQKNIEDGYAQAVIVNSGNANTCNANGVEIAWGMCELVEQHTEISAKDVIVASTGVIGQQLSLEPMINGMAELVGALDKNSSPAAEAIMTTDLKKKEISVSFELGGKVCKMGAIAKGSGMINPNMATMLAFITTDTAILPQMLQKALSADVTDSFNMISVDGDTSTNDMVSILANGMAGNREIDTPGEDYNVFCRTLAFVTQELSRMIAGDGEGASRLIECRVSGAPDKGGARVLAKSVINSPLVKTAMFGADANWGRVLCALGYAGVNIDVSKVAVSFCSSAGTILVCTDGRGIEFSEDEAKKILSQDEILIQVDLTGGEGEATAWGCDLSYEYVRINGDYRT